MVETRKNKRRNGGAATVFPLKYYDPSAHEPSAGAGRDLLQAMPPLGVRPRIGGKRRLRHSKRRLSRKLKGGFVPSVMDGFVAAASKYIVPMALFAGYKLMTRTKKKAGRRTRRRV
jgi:hypothetical protein